MTAQTADRARIVGIMVLSLDTIGTRALSLMQGKSEMKFYLRQVPPCTRGKVLYKYHSPTASVSSSRAPSYIPSSCSIERMM